LLICEENIKEGCSAVKGIGRMVF